MLISFSVRNHRSIKDQVVLNLEATNDDHLEESRVITWGKSRLLRSVAIYGANASCKSNIVKAIKAMQRIVLAATSPSVMSLPASVSRHISVEPFRLSTLTQNAPSGFHVEFILEDYTYSYGFEVTAVNVVSEYLTRKGELGKEAMLFEREANKPLRIGDGFAEGKAREQFLRPNSLFVSLCAELNGEISTKILKWFQKINILDGLSDAQNFYDTYERMRDPDGATALADFARRADLGISGLKLREFDAKNIRLPAEIPQEVRDRQVSMIVLQNTDIATRHTKYGPGGEPSGEVELSLKQHESSGTQKFVMLAAPLQKAIDSDAVVIIDEFDSRLHPLLTRELFEWFHGKSNSSKAQLILCTHDVLLMEPERIRRDQVWFAEKDSQGGTILHSLAEYPSDEVRPTTKFGRRYLLGIFGAVPHPNLREGG